MSDPITIETATPAIADKQRDKVWRDGWHDGFAAAIEFAAGILMIEGKDCRVEEIQRLKAENEALRSMPLSDATWTFKTLGGG